MNKIIVKAGTIELETHWAFRPSVETPSFVRIIQDGEVIAFEQFGPPESQIKGGYKS